MFYERSVKFILLTFFGSGLLAIGACSNDRPGEDSQSQSALFAKSPTAAANSQLVVVTATLKDSHAGLLAGRRFVLQSDDGNSVRSLTDASGTLSLRLISNRQYTLRPTKGADSDALLKLEVDSNGTVNVTESRRLFAADLQSTPPASAKQDANSAKFQSARFGESVFAP